MAPYIADDNLMSSKDEQDTDRHIYERFLKTGCAENNLKTTKFSSHKIDALFKNFYGKISEKWCKRRDNKPQISIFDIFMMLVVIKAEGSWNTLASLFKISTAFFSV